MISVMDDFPYALIIQLNFLTSIRRSRQMHPGFWNFKNLQKGVNSVTVEEYSGLQTGGLLTD
jgi:hypothetical protein